MVFKYWMFTLFSINAPFKKRYRLFSPAKSHEKRMWRCQRSCLAWFHDFSYFFLLFAFWFFLLKAVRYIKRVSLIKWISLWKFNFLLLVFIFFSIWHRTCHELVNWGFKFKFKLKSLFKFYTVVVYFMVVTMKVPVNSA